MNIKTREIIEIGRISAAEIASGDWRELPKGLGFNRATGKATRNGRDISKSDARREIYMEEVARKRKAERGET